MSKLTSRETGDDWMDLMQLLLLSSSALVRNRTVSSRRMSKLTPLLVAAAKAETTGVRKKTTPS